MNNSLQAYRSVNDEDIRTQVMRVLYMRGAATAELVARELRTDQFTAARSIPARLMELHLMGIVTAPEGRTVTNQNGLEVQVYELSRFGRKVVEAGPDATALLDDLNAVRLAIQKRRAEALAPHKRKWRLIMTKTMLDTRKNLRRKYHL